MCNKQQAAARSCAQEMEPETLLTENIRPICALVCLRICSRKRRGPVFLRWWFSPTFFGGCAEWWAVMEHTGDGHRGRLHYASPCYLLCATNCVFPRSKMQFLPGVDPHTVMSSARSAGCRVRLWISLTSKQRQRRLGSSQRSICSICS